MLVTYIAHKPTYEWYADYTDTILEIDPAWGTYDFTRDEGPYHDVGSKLNFCILQVLYAETANPLMGAKYRKSLLRGIEAQTHARLIDLSAVISLFESGIARIPIERSALRGRNTKVLYNQFWPRCFIFNKESFLGSLEYYKEQANKRKVRNEN